MKIAQLVYKKVRFFVRCAWFEVWIRLASERAIEEWREDTIAMCNRQWEQEFSTPDGLDWLENDLKENGHMWKSRQVEKMANWLLAHGREVPEWAECTEY